jgi:hypothetical protein
MTFWSKYIEQPSKNDLKAAAEDMLEYRQNSKNVTADEFKDAAYSAARDMVRRMDEEDVYAALMESKESEDIEFSQQMEKIVNPVLKENYIAHRYDGSGDEPYFESRTLSEMMVEYGEDSF